ncbi:MAG: proline--tRNA ligase [Gammaproteobacteria bacterium]|mgnify:FL=1|nr:proline--tRNA ligase [Gammaproteobacteria bacterium]|tara:strand:- start:200107 stop:201360 length:1254 start_codon:yes stop_codon:yes gene_type:complete
MKASIFPIFTLKDDPSDAEILSHKLMIKAGLIRKLNAGLYTWLPLGMKLVSKISKIIIEEMNNIGSMEILMPSIQPADLWKESERWDQYGPELLRIQDRHERDFCFGPTFEEVITDIIRKEINSYKQLPLNLFQISTKFRDEIRPRFGVIRAREFIMKDAYSFHSNQECLNVTYEKYKSAYINIFNRLGLDFRIVEADSGNIGGNESHEFHVIAETGEDDLLLDDSMVGMNVEIAKRKYGHDNIDDILKEKNLKHVKGIEVGHIFKLGDKYSSKMKAMINTKESQNINILMGCYGIGVTRIIAAAIEQNSSNDGIIWPEALEPFKAVIAAIDGNKNSEIKKYSEEIYQMISKDNNLDILLDDRDLRLGNKINDYELIGIKKILIIGKDETTNKTITLKINNDKKLIPINELLSYFSD